MQFSLDLFLSLAATTSISLRFLSFSLSYQSHLVVFTLMIVERAIIYLHCVGLIASGLLIPAVLCNGLRLLNANYAADIAS